MCGICGIVNLKNGNVPKQKLLTMRESLSHRGPDGSGSYFDNNVGLGHRRLAILDLSKKGKQPMISHDGRYCITYNGEVYNFNEIKKELISPNFKFKSNTDTEVLLALYEKYKYKMLSFLNGMFAFAIWDSKNKSLFIARDRLGIKPLFYMIIDGFLYFSSEIKSLSSICSKMRLNENSISEMLIFRSVAGEETPYQGIKKILPGHYMVLKNSKLEMKQWWHKNEYISSNDKKNDFNYVNWFKKTFDESVKYRLISDAPVGILLSGGADSASIAAAISKNGDSGLSSYTMAFDDEKYDESNIVDDVVNKYNFKSHKLKISEKKLYKGLVESIEYNDEPLAHNHEQHILALSRLAKKSVKVLLAGEGSDELMAGYVRHRPVNYFYILKKINSLFGLLKKNNRMKKLNKMLSLKNVDDFILFNSCNILPSDLYNIGYKVETNFAYRKNKLAKAKAAYPFEPLRQQLIYDLSTHLVSLFDRLDRMTMAASIECRVPFMDHRIVEKIINAPSNVISSKLLSRGSKGKKLLYDSIGHRLPQSVMSGKKWGFGVPWSEYFKRDKILIAEMKNLSEMKFIKYLGFKKSVLDNLISEYYYGDNSNFNLLVQLYFTSLWYDIKIR